MKTFLADRESVDISTWLGMFGSPTPKCIRLWSNHPFVGGLKRTGSCLLLRLMSAVVRQEAGPLEVWQEQFDQGLL